MEVLGLRRSYGSVTALSDVTIHVASGEIRALLGPNGAGKTTLVRILAGLVEPTAGTVRVLGREASSPALRARVGLVPSGDRSFYLRLSGLENLLFFARLQGFGRRAARDRASELLERVGLGDAGHRPVGAYSHGMQKRLGVARGLLADPEVLLVDEATHDLDPASARSIRELVAGLASSGTAVVWTTQRVDEIRGFADTVTILKAGSVCFEGSVTDLVAAGRRTRARRTDHLEGSEIEDAFLDLVGEGAA